MWPALSQESLTGRRPPGMLLLITRQICSRNWSPALFLSLSCVDLDVGCRVADVFMGPLDSVTTYCCWLPLGMGYSLCWIFARDSLPSTAYSFPLTPILWKVRQSASLAMALPGVCRSQSTCARMGSSSHWLSLSCILVIYRHTGMTSMINGPSLVPWFPLFPYLNNISRIAVANCSLAWSNLSPCFPGPSRPVISHE